MMHPVTHDVEAIVNRMKAKGATIFYEYGHRKEISARLAEKGTDAVKMNERYPMFLLESAPEEVIVDGVRNITMNIGIFASTKHVDQGATSLTRINEVIVPVLYPLYDLFFQCMLESGYYSWTGYQPRPPHTKRDKPLWSIEDREGNLKFILSDPLDAILIEGLKVSQRLNQCKTPNLYSVPAQIIQQPNENDIPIYRNGKLTYMHISEFAQLLQDVPL